MIMHQLRCIGRTLARAGTESVISAFGGECSTSYNSLLSQSPSLARRVGSRSYSQAVLPQSSVGSEGSVQGLRAILERLGQRHSTPQTSTAGNGHWTCKAALRWQSTAPKPSLDAGEAQQRLSRLVRAPGDAVRSARAGVSQATTAVYNRLPQQAKQLVMSVSQPGSFQKVIKLQLEAFWGNHGRKVLALGGVLLVYALWRTLFKVASTFLNLSETMADFGFLALAAALASFGYLYLRRLYTIRPDSVYRLAMLQLNTNPGVLEVMGAPVAGSNVRATVLTGGGLRLKGLVPKLRSRRVQMIFPLAGSERRGLVSLEAKKLKGKYLFKLLAVDVPSAAGPEQRLYLEGDEKAYARGGVIAELRDPFLHALSMRDAHELEDEIDDAAHEADAAHRKRARDAAKLQSAPKPLDQGGGMYFYERAYWAIRRFLAGRQTAISAKEDVAKSNVTTPPVKEAAQQQQQQQPPPPAKAAEALDPGKLPPQQPSAATAEKVHQYKKEASVQQAP